MEALGGHKIFSALDCTKGYHQLEVDPVSRHLTTFSCHKGLFQYKRVPFGLRNAPAVFQRFMDSLLGPLRSNSALVYLDDVVIFSRTMDEHINSLRILFDAARRYSGFKVDLGSPRSTR